jgi:arginine decarboxylase
MPSGKSDRYSRCNDFDETKLGVNVRGLGFTGYQMENKLRKEYNIQVEMSDIIIFWP